MYGLEAFALNRASMQSLDFSDFSDNRFLMKLFRTSSAEIVTVVKCSTVNKLLSIVLAEQAKKLQYSTNCSSCIGLYV